MKNEKRLKRFLAFLLCAAMLVTYMPSSAYTLADKTSDEELTENVGKPADNAEKPADDADDKSADKVEKSAAKAGNAAGNSDKKESEK